MAFFNANIVLQKLNMFFPLKLGFGSPDMYPGVKLHKISLYNGVLARAISLVKYVQEAV